MGNKNIRRKGRRNPIAIAVRLALISLFITSTLYISDYVNAANRYEIKINKQQNCVTIYELGANGKYKPIKAFICSTGSDTPLGTFGLKEKIRWHELDGPVYGQYCTRITGHVLFHSVWYHVNGNPATLSNYQYNRLGQTASHGCVRLTVEDAKWIYENVPFGTKVTIYNAKSPGPLGKPKAIKLPDGTGWDPTDTTNPNNPYNKKKPSLKVKGGKITYAAPFHIMDKVVAKNTTGFDAKELVKCTIQYKVKGAKTYKKVKTINTKKPGTYRVSYKLTDEINRTVKKNVTYKVLTKVSIKKISLNKTSRTLYLGGDAKKKAYRLKVSKVTPKNASIKEVQYVSSDPKIVTVKDDGLVTAKKTGMAEVTALAKDGSGKKAVCKFTVKRYASSVTLEAATSTISVGDELALKATVKPNGTSNKKLAFTTSDPTIATVDGQGIVKGLKPGTVTITATTMDGSGKTASIKITVNYTFDSTVTDHMGRVEVKLGSSLETAIAALPTVVAVKDKKGNIGSAIITWTIPAYNPDLAYDYTAEGTITLPNGWVGNPGKIYATVALVK